MIERYSTEKMQALWSTKARYQRWLDVEIAIVWGWVEAGVVPTEAAQVIEEKARVDVDRIRQIEETARHDVAAFVQSIEEAVGPEAGKWVHFGITSSDVLDTALALQLVEALEIIDEQALVPLLQILRKRAFEYRDVLSMGRTHGIHAEPTSLGLLFAGWYEELSRHRTRLQNARRAIAVGQVSGPVGSYASVPPQVEEEAMRRLGLEVADFSTQIISRDRHASLVCDLAILGSTIEKIATEIRHRARTEVAEFAEAFFEGQKGSSAMPHKKNPVLSENLTGLARLLRSYTIPALENVALWHERDISHSSVERVILPDATAIADFALRRLRGVLENLVVDEEALRDNLATSGGRHHSQFVLLKLIKAGYSREDAYALVQRAAFEAEGGDESFLEIARQSCDVNLEEGADPLRQVDRIFARIFNGDDDR